MQFTEDQAADVKNWVVKKLEDISDADSDVLADYVLALIRSDAPDEEIRKVSVENLEDFLKEHTAPFVDELFASFGPKQFPAPTAAALPPTQPQQPTPGASHTQQPFNAPTGPRADFNNRKRSFHEGFQPEQEFENGAPQNRAFKTPRRGRGSGGGRGDWMGRDGRYDQQFQANASGGFPMMPGFPPFDQNDPMAAMMAMQGMGFPQMPGMPMPGMPGSEQMGSVGNQRCPFYDTQGICYMGTACPYTHGEGGSKADEYDPKTASLGMDTQPRDGYSARGDRGRGRGRGGFGGRGRGRSDFSSAGPNEDRTITTIVVEQIPDDKFSQEAVREFFSQFGNIVEVTLQPYKKLALVQFDTYAEAKQAWSSPKVIFDNRFVKVYWYKPKRDEKSGDDAPDAPAFNQEEFEKQQEEAQKSYEDKMKRRQETEEAKQALERQRDELLQKQQEEKTRLLQRLGVGPDASDSSTVADGASGQATPDENASDETKQLRAQLAALEAEAKTLGLDPEGAARGRGGYRGRGAPRGRGGYRGRGGFDPSFRGGYRGRGAFAPRGRGGVLRLDNRPRRVAVAGVELHSDKDEALRQRLIGIGEYESIEPNPGNPGSVVVTFKERYQAEKFMFSPWNIPSVGEVQLSWLPNLPITVTPNAAAEKNGLDDEQDTEMQSASTPPVTAPARDMDYDVAEDDSWGAQ